MLMRAFIPVFLFFCVIAILGSAVYIGHATWQEIQRTRRAEADVQIENAHTEQAAIGLQVTQEQNEHEETVARLNATILELQAALVEVTARAEGDLALYLAAAKTVESNQELIDWLVRQQNTTIRREEAQEDRGAFIDVVWDKFGAVLSIGVAVLAYAIGKQG